ncbi:MAG: cytochrome c oxidase subunit II [Candidatus Omnitrophica bacterium]|nr:cytochrome c oxidase subunit II [Candidatus Omnitrophota bacterium]
MREATAGTPHSALRRAVGATLCVLAAPVNAWAFGSSGVRIWLPEAVTTTAPAIDRLFYIVLVITGVVFVLVQATLLLFILRYRRRPGRSAAYTHGNQLAEIIWTVIPALIMVWLTFKSQRVWSHVRGTPPPPDLEVEVTGEQFAWNVRYAGADGALNTADDITTINQMHLPVGRTVLLHLKSKDVIHSFFVPQFRVKQDAVPGITTRLWVNATKTGHYEIACAELCGLGHYRMRGFLVIESPEALTTWLSEQLAEQAS